MESRLCTRVGVNLLLVLALTLSSYAQTETATLSGRVIDPQGAVVPRTQVQATNIDTNVKVTTETNDAGIYVVLNLRPGRYRIIVRKDGFKEIVKTDVVLHVQDVVAHNFSLEVGSVAQSITVTGGAPLVETKDPTLGKVIENKMIVNLPLNGRNFMQLTVLVPGSVPALNYGLPATPEMPGGINATPQVNGLRSESNTFLLDGADNNEPFLGSAAVVPSVEAIQEFKMQSNVYNAEYGSVGGAVINVVTKSGTNELHGNVYEFLRNDVFDARNFFASEVAPLRRNQFGFSLGGPIRRNRTFLFGNYEGLRERAGITRTAVVPSSLERLGDFSQSAVKPVDPLTGQPFPQDRIPIARLHPISQQLLQFYPEPNNGLSRFLSSPTSSTANDQFLLRLDHKIAEKNDLMVRYLFQDGGRGFHFVKGFLGDIDVPNFPVSDTFRLQNLSITDVHIFSTTIVNQARLGYNRAHLVAATPEFAIDPQALGFTFPAVDFQNVPYINISGLTSVGTSVTTGDTDKLNNIVTIEDTVSILRGRHLVKIGGRASWTRVDVESFNGFPGSFLFAGLFSGNATADFLLGSPLLFFQTGGDPNRNYRTSEYTYFIHDSFTVTPSFTLSLGLRHEIFQPVYDTGGRMATFRPGAQSTVRPQVPPGVLFPGDPGITRSTWERDNNNISPRVGFAWNVFNKGKTSLRGGYGLSYDPPVTFVTFQTFLAPSLFQIGLVFVPNYADPFAGSSPFQPGASEFAVLPGTQVNFLSPTLATPYVQQYNLSVQHELAKEYVLEVAYVGTKGTKLLGTVQVNPPVFVAGSSTPANIQSRRPVQPWGQVFEQRSGFSSNYNALQTSLTKYFSKGLSFLASYTFSKTIDLVSVPQQFQFTEGQPPTVNAANPRDLNAERAVAAFDVPHRLVLSFTAELPFLKGQRRPLARLLGGWQVSGIVQVQSGLPFTVFDDSDPSFDGETSDRPNLVGECNPSDFARTIDSDFNTSAFERVLPGSGLFGTAGRNACRARGTENVDLSVLKTFELNERFELQFRAEVFNLFNHPNFAPPVNNINSPDFGRILNTVRTNERQMQFGLKLEF